MGQSESSYETPEVAEMLDELRDVFNRKTGKQDAYLHIFDEFIEESQFYAALHVVCDYLMEPENRVIDADLLDRIAAIHDLMQLEDYCVEMLQAKTLPR
jgi:hypothetical protein